MADGRPNVFGLSRDIWNHPVFADEPFSEREAWAWLIGAAAWKRINTRGNAGAVTLERGEFSFSIRFLAEKWKWKKDRVARFITRLKKRDMLRDTRRDSCEVYFICNYNKFQKVGVSDRDSARDTERDANATAPRQHRDKEETGETGEYISPSQSSVEDTPASKPSCSKPSGRAELPGFEKFWDAYPRPLARGAARKAYAGALKKASPEAILAGAERYAQSRLGDDPKFTKHPSTWLNGECWADGGGGAGSLFSIDSAPDPNARAPCIREPGESDEHYKVRRYVERKFWLSTDGPPPDDPDCLFPKPVLQEFGFLKVKQCA